MALPLIASAAIAGLQGVATIAGGVQSARASKAAELGARIEQQMALLRRVQIQEASRENLATALGTTDAIRTARGMSLDSPTARAIERRTRRDAYRDEAVAALAELHRAGSAGQTARGHASAARWAVPLAIVSAAGSFANAYGYGKAALAGPSTPPVKGG